MSENDKTFVIPTTNMQPSLDSLYLELGQAYYEGAFEDPLPQLLPLFDRITQLKKQMAEHTLCCPQCGVEIKKDAVFCGECGYKIK